MYLMLFTQRELHFKLSILSVCFYKLECVLDLQASFLLDQGFWFDDYDDEGLLNPLVSGAVIIAHFYWIYLESTVECSIAHLFLLIFLMQILLLPPPFSPFQLILILCIFKPQPLLIFQP